MKRTMDKGKQEMMVMTVVFQAKFQDQTKD
jgi:hypothetical protein